MIGREGGTALASRKAFTPFSLLRARVRNRLLVMSQIEEGRSVVSFER
jgi:hypothetical protein